MSRSKSQWKLPHWVPADPAERIRALGIPPEFERASVSDFGSTEIGLYEHGRETWRQWSNDDFALADGPRSWLIVGANGSGKSHLAAALAFRFGAQWMTMEHIRTKLLGAKRFSSEISVDGVRKYYSELPYIVIDDFFAASFASDEVISFALSIIGARINYRRPTIITMDKSLRSVEAIDTSIHSRLYLYEHVKCVFRGHSSGDRRRVR